MLSWPYLHRSLQRQPQAAARHGLLPAPGLRQHAQRLLATLVEEIKRQPGQSWDPQAAATFTATVLSALRKNQLAEMLEDPEMYGLPSLFASAIRQHLRLNPGLARAVSAHPSACKQLETQLLKQGQLALSPALAASP